LALVPFQLAVNPKVVLPPAPIAPEQPPGAGAPPQRAAPGRPWPADGPAWERLNQIDGEDGFIETTRREEAGDAFAELAARGGVPAELAADWFDD
jgi:hypothetical protein